MDEAGEGQAADGVGDGGSPAQAGQGCGYCAKDVACDMGTGARDCCHEHLAASAPTVV